MENRHRFYNYNSYHLQKLHTEDLIDFYLPRDRRILPLNKIKEALVLSPNDDYQSVKKSLKELVALRLFF